MQNYLELLERAGIVPVVTVTEAAQGVPLARALQQGGFGLVEITLRTAAALDAVRDISREMPEMCIGAGTVLSPQQAQDAAAAGAHFMVSPGFNPRVVDACLQQGIPIIPGCATPTDMEAALERGLSVVKFFPAEPAGGLAYIKACAAPYPGLRFMPTGGIYPGNVREYLAFEKIIACGGSWMAPLPLVEAGDFGEIGRLAREARALAKRHIV